MKYCRNLWALLTFIVSFGLSFAAPVIDFLPNVSLPAGKSLTIPITAASPNGRPLTYTITSNTNRITIEHHTNNPFWKMSVVQAAPVNTPGAFQTPFRGGLVTVTNIGDLTMMLFRDRAPRSVDVFTGLSGSGFYNSNTIFHRVIPGFMIQGGCPLTNGTSGPVFRYEDEFHPRAIFSGSGQLALANSGKDTDGSQFFITLGPQRFLDFGYTLFGQLLRGFSVVSNVISTPRNANDRPLADVIITRASLVPNTTDTVITLSGTNLVGVVGTIQVIADDGLAGGRATNTFTATTGADANNTQPILYPETVTNRVTSINGRLTNYVAALDLEGSAYYWYPLAYSNAASNSVFSVVDGQLQMGTIPNNNFAGVVEYLIVVSSSPDWYTYYQFFPQNQWPSYDWQNYRFVFGDTAISALGTNLIAHPLGGFTNQILATFTNGVPNSPSNNFIASINWGDNATNSGIIVTNLSGRKEVRGTHTYTNSGHYPIYVTIRSALGAEATAVTTAYVQPSLSLTHTGTTNQLRWPAWANDYQLQFHTNPASSNWVTATNFPSLTGYELALTNVSASSNLFFRLKR